MTSHHHHQSVPETKIEAFWTWFEEVAADLGANLGNDMLLSELDDRVATLGDVSWEVGPGADERYSFVITPDGSKELLGLCDRIVSLAPEVSQWEFHSARPPREWDMRFTLGREAGRILDVDARTWRYVLFKFADGAFDIIVEQPNLGTADEQDRYAAAVMLIDGILGERRRLQLINEVEPVVVLAAEEAERASKVNVLAKHLASLGVVE
jgi:hypothetical protein